jgi:hypothetical protein
MFFSLDSNEHYFRERYHIPRIPCGDHFLVCVLYSIHKLFFMFTRKISVTTTSLQTFLHFN